MTEIFTHTHFADGNKMHSLDFYESRIVCVHGIKNNFHILFARRW